MKRTWIKNANIVNEGKSFVGSVVICGEVIDEIIEGNEEPSAPCEEIIDAQGYYLLPGIIDDHVHFRDPGLTHKADMHSESKAAAAGGVTSYMDMPNTVPQTTTIEALNDKFADAATKSIVNYSFYFGATNDNVSLLPHLDKQRICGIKLFMGSSTGNMLVDQLDTLKYIFTHAHMLIAAHCEDQEIIQANIDVYKNPYEDDLPIHYHPLIRDKQACYKSSQLAIELAKETNARLHIMHISTDKELELSKRVILSVERDGVTYTGSIYDAGKSVIDLGKITNSDLSVGSDVLKVTLTFPSTGDENDVMAGSFDFEFGFCLWHSDNQGA